MLRLTFIVCALVAAMACGRAAPVVERHDRVVVPGREPVEVLVLAAPQRGGDADRDLRAASASIRMLSVWFGALQPRAITLADRVGGDASAQAIVVPPIARWSAPGAMVPELALARAVSRHYWTALFDSSSLPGPFVDGLIEYSARRSVEPLFQSQNQPPGYAMVDVRLFGGLVPLRTRLRLTPETGDRAVVAIDTLERWLSRPVLDGALADFIASSRGRTPGLGDLEETISSASGQDLSWLFAQALDGTADFDYAVAGLSTARDADGRFTTTVVVERRGTGIFSGTAQPRVGPFESGAGVVLQTTFADGREIRDTWDGRDASRRFVYQGPSPAVWAVVDPDRVIALDAERTNNSRTLRPRSSTAASRWAARWSLWLENLLMTYTFFI